MKINDVKWIVLAVCFLVLVGGAFWGGYRVCVLRRVLPLEEAIARAEKASEILAEQVVSQAKEIEEAKRVEIEGMDPHDVVIEFLSPDAVSQLTDTADGIARRAARAVIEYLRGRGVDFVTVHDRSLRGRGQGRGP